MARVNWDGLSRSSFLSLLYSRRNQAMPSQYVYKFLKFVKQMHVAISIRRHRRNGSWVTG